MQMDDDMEPESVSLSPTTGQMLAQAGGACRKLVVSSAMTRAIDARDNSSTTAWQRHHYTLPAPTSRTLLRSHANDISTLSLNLTIMAEALETKKRRLYKYLDNLSSSDVTFKSPSTSTTSSAKRSLTISERFDEARERASKRLRHSTSTGSLSSLPTKVETAKAVARKDGDDKPPPNFSPWSHDMFLQRLRTFSSVSVWHPKPEGISEVEWAKRGWRCVDVNTVACKGGCERRVVVSIDVPTRIASEEQDDGEDEGEEDAQEEFERALVERYKDVIAEGHAEHCMWHSSGCRDDVYRVQVIRPSVWQPELRKRCKSILAISPAIENLTLKPVVHDGLKIQPAERLIKDLPADLTSADDTPADATTTTTKALAISLHGWRGSREAGSELLHCDACFQRIGLWMYQPDYKRSRPMSAPANEDDGEDAEEDTATIDLTELHREHCPWRNPATQKASGSLAGLNACQILQRVVTTYARDHRRRSAEQENDAPGLDQQNTGVEEEMALEHSTPKTKAMREEIAKQDTERESRLRKLKSLFSVRRKGAKAPAAR